MDVHEWLREAARRLDNLEIVRLLKRGADPNAADERGYTALAYALTATQKATDERVAVTAKLLLRVGARLDATSSMPSMPGDSRSPRDRLRWSAAWRTVRADDPELATLLLSQWPDLARDIGREVAMRADRKKVGEALSEWLKQRDAASPSTDASAAAAQTAPAATPRA